MNENLAVMSELAGYHQQIEEALKRKECVVIGCRCEVWYSGRAESHLPVGDRMVLIKEDGTLIVHQPAGNNPVNYMKPETRHSLVFEDGQLFLNSQNLGLKEFLDARIDRVHFVSSAKLEDGQTIEVTGTEKDMSDMLYSNPNMIEDGFKAVSREEQTRYGFIDVLGVDRRGILTAVECKRYCADHNAVMQLRRYVEKLKASKGISSVRGILAAPKITGNASAMLKDWGFEFVAVSPPKYLERFNKDQKTLGGFL